MIEKWKVFGAMAEGKEKSKRDLDQEGKRVRYFDQEERRERGCLERGRRS